MTRAAIYTRVSTEEQARGHTAIAERTKLGAWAAAEGWEVVEYYDDPGFSAKDMDTAPRPAFTRALAEAGSVFDVLLVEKQDRFARNIADAYAAKKRLKQSGARVMYYIERAANEQSPTGLLMEAIGFSSAEAYLLDLSTKIAKGYHSKAVLKGLHIGDVPFGYARPADPRTDPMPVDEHEAAGVRWAFETYARGQSSYAEVGDGLEALGYAPHSRRGRTRWSASTVKKMLQNRVYLGEVTYHGVQYAGRHSAIVDEAMFNAVQVAASRRKRAPRSYAPASSVYMVTGIGICVACGSRLWADGGSRLHRRRPYYRCSSRSHRQRECRDARQGIAAEVVEDRLRTLVVGTARALPGLEDMIAEAVEAMQVPDEADERVRLEAVIARASRLMLLGGDESQAAHAIQSARRAIAALDAAPQAVAAGPSITRCADLWPHFTPAERREAAHLMFERVAVSIAEQTVYVLPRPEYAAAYEAVAMSGEGPVALDPVLVPPERFGRGDTSDLTEFAALVREGTPARWLRVSGGAAA